MCIGYMKYYIILFQGLEHPQFGAHGRNNCIHIIHLPIYIYTIYIVCIQLYIQLYICKHTPYIVYNSCIHCIYKYTYLNLYIYVYINICIYKFIFYLSFIYIYTIYCVSLSTSLSSISISVCIYIQSVQSMTTSVQISFFQKGKKILLKF